jgi:formate hydrogenlyase transcriptional activator
LCDFESGCIIIFPVIEPAEQTSIVVRDKLMSTDLPQVGTNERYEAVLRISEGLCAVCGPKELAKSLADQLQRFLPFDHLDVVVFKENSTEIECHVWGKGPLPEPADVPLHQLPGWNIGNTQEALHIPDWDNEEQFARLKTWANEIGAEFGSILRVPLTTPHRRLGALGIVSSHPNAYSSEDITFLRMIARVAAFAIDDGLNLRRAQDAQACVQHQNDRLQLLLNLTNRITSNLELRDVLRTIAANIREVMQSDAVAILLPDPASGMFRLHALDSPGAIGVEEGTLKPLTGTGKLAFETLKPAVASVSDPNDFPPEIYEKLRAAGLTTHCAIPLVNRGHALGILGIARKTGEFTQRDIDFVSQAGGQIAIAIENALAYGEISELKDKLAQEKLYLEEEIRSEMDFDQIIGSSPALKHVLQLVETVAPSDSTVLLLGETGTGKELIARAIHEHSRRKDRTFVKLNCAAIPTGLLESELFGHEKGAFTGAISQKVGRLELADQGTLFLDEVGDVPIEIQPKLLRALQEREFERLGSTHTRKVNVRLVAATNRDLEKMIADREFRSDLYYRLNVFPIRIPPLRERKEDIPLLVSYFVQKFAKQMQKTLETVPAAVMRGLVSWEWPGNIRELENFIERAVILTRGRSLEAPLFELRKPSNGAAAPAPGKSAQDDIARIVKETISALNGNKDVADEYARKQRDEIVRVLGETRGRVGGSGGAAARMGINRTTLLSRMKKFGIDPRQYA